MRPIRKRRTGMERRPWGPLALALLVGASFVATGSAIAEKPGDVDYREKLREMRRERARKGPADRERDVANAAYPWATPDDVNYIDTMLREEWEALGFPLASEADDLTFLRRVTLDTIGRVPTYAEVQQFLNDRSRERRVNAVNRLLASPEYGRHWANIWVNLIRDSGPNNNRFEFDEFHAWLETQFNRNRPWNEMVREMVAARGRTDENGAANFIAAKRVNGMEGIVVSTATKLFLGVQTQCTECHDHPWNEWKQNQFHGMLAFFKGTSVEEVRVTGANGQLVTDHWVVDEMPFDEIAEKGAYYERRNGLTLYTMPTYIDGRDIYAILKGEPAREAGTQTVSLQDFQFRFDDELSAVDSASGPVRLRSALADVITAEDNPYFARAIVNRLWYNYFGHSFLNNVDDFDNGQDEPSMPALLDRMANDFKANGYDLKRLSRWIATSEAYALESRPKGRNLEDAEGFFTYQLVKPMTPEQLFESVITLTRYDKTSTDANTAALKERFLSDFRRTFGSGSQATTTPEYDGTITQALMMMNSPTMTQACSCKPGSFVYDLMQDNSFDNDGERIEAIYLASLCRKPTSKEMRDIRRVFGNPASDQARMWMLEDVLWATMNSAEFILNH